MRRIGSCTKCGEPREMAAHGLCFRCYRTEARAGEGRLADVDRHSVAVRRERTKLFRGFLNVMVGLNELGVSEADVIVIRRMLEPCLTLVSKLLVPETEIRTRAADVNSERDFGAPFTVRTFPNEDAASAIDTRHDADALGPRAERT
jgi:hypothetical protein